MTASTATPPLLRRLVVIGLGLIGGSLASAVRGRGLSQEVWGVAPREDVRRRALELGIVDCAVSSISDIAAELGEGDLIFIAVPTLTVAQILGEIAACVSAKVTVTDGASVKGSVLADVQRIYGFVPEQIVLGHPIAGSEKSGVEAANPDLYEQHRVILTPVPETSAHHLSRVQNLWEAVGAEVLHLDVQQHDEILAATSHLPHAIAFSLVDTLAHDSQNQDIFRYAAGGFRDFTRIASSDATMWRDIMLANGPAVVKAIDLFAANLDRLRQAVIQQDDQELLGVFTRAKAARDHFTKMLQNRALVETNADTFINLKVSAGTPVKGVVQIPGDRSISHRAIMLGALAEGTTEINGFLESEDALATLQAFRDMGVVIAGPSRGRVTVHGVGVHGLQPPVGPLYLGNSGTSLRLLAGILVGQPFDTVLTGGPVLSSKSMARVIEPLTQMGARIAAAEGDDLPPLHITGSRALKGIDYSMPKASAQVKSCLLLAGLYAQGPTRIREPFTTRDHTERMLEGLNYPLGRDLNSVELTPGGTLRACRIDVPADISAAIFFMVAATIVEGSDLLLPRVGINPTRLGAVNILQMMGADIAFANVHKVGGEPVADIRVRYAPLKGAVVPEAQVALAVHEIPALMVAAACAEGTTVFVDTDQLHLAQNHRVRAILAGLAQFGIRSQAQPDSLQILGGPMAGGEVDGEEDARVAMAFTVAGLRAQAPVLVRRCSCIATYFPDFVAAARSSGITLEVLSR